MKKFNVWVNWEMHTVVQIEAESEEDARSRVLNGPLPLDGNFTKSSLEVDDIEEVD